MGREKLGYSLMQQLAKFAEESLGGGGQIILVLNKRTTCPKYGSRQHTGDVNHQYKCVKLSLPSYVMAQSGNIAFDSNHF